MTDTRFQPGTGDDVRSVALAICKSRTCEGVSCCQWPANMGRTNCNAKNGAYDDAARAAIAVLSSDVAVAALDREQIARTIAKHMWCGATYDDATEAEKDAFVNAADAVLAVTRPHQPGGGR